MEKNLSRFIAMPSQLIRDNNFKRFFSSRIGKCVIPFHDLAQGEAMGDEPPGLQSPDLHDLHQQRSRYGVDKMGCHGDIPGPKSLQVQFNALRMHADVGNTPADRHN